LLDTHLCGFEVLPYAFYHDAKHIVSSGISTCVSQLASGTSGCIHGIARHGLTVHAFERQGLPHSVMWYELISLRIRDSSLVLDLCDSSPIELELTN